VETYAIASRSADKARETSVKYGISKFYPSYEELLSDDSIEMVFIPLPNHLHAEWIKKSADAGKHILCEKPIAMNAREALSAVRYAAGRKVKLMEAFMYRFHRQWTSVKAILSEGGLGNITSVNTFFGYFNRDAANIRNIHKFGGGALLDIGCYAASSARFILNGEPDRVIALNSFDSEFDTDYLSSGILDFGGTRAVYSVSTQTFPWQKVEIHGSSGVLTVDIPFNPIPDMPMKLFLTKDTGTRIIETEACDHYKLQVDGFAKAILEDSEVPTPVSDAIANMKVLDALFESGKRGGWVKI
jgi:predicted dehydrogenase